MEQSTSIVEPDKSKGKAIITQSEDIALNDLKESDTSKAIYVKVYRKWTPTNKQGKPVVFCCILIDRQGGAIQANVNLREKPKFDALLQINRTCKITGFGFQPAKPYMQAVPHTLSLLFGTCTDIKDIPDTGFPEHYFNFSSYRDLYSKVDVKEGLLTDYVGSVQYVTEIQHSTKATQSSTVWRDIGVQNLDGHTVRFTLWNEDAHSFRKTEYEQAEKPVIIAVSSCLVKNYGGLQLSSTSATSYYFNPDIPQVKEIRDVYEEFIDPPTILNIQHQRYADPDQEKYRNRVTLADLAAENPQNQQNVRFTVTATINEVDTTRTWFFKKCFDCGYKISDRFPHSHCKQPDSDDDLRYSYCFRVVLSDATTTGIMTCFSNEANSLVKDCKELCKAIPNPNPYDYPAELLSLQGKRKIFQLHFDPESTKEKQVFILDTCWDDTPMLTANVTALPESNIESSMQNTLATITTETESEIAETPLPEVSPPKTETNPATVMNVPSESTVAKADTPDTFEPSETDTTPPPKQTPISETSKAKTQQPKRGARKGLFTQTKDAQGTTSNKKSKQND